MPERATPRGGASSQPRPSERRGRREGPNERASPPAVSLGRAKRQMTRPRALPLEARG